jgi:hypothetical protein
MWSDTANSHVQAAEYQWLAGLAAQSEEQEAALDRGDVFAAALLAAMDTTRWDEVVSQASSGNTLWAAAIQEHAGEVRRRLQHTLSAATTRRPATAAPRAAYISPMTGQQGRCWAA